MSNTIVSVRIAEWRKATTIKTVVNRNKNILTLYKTTNFLQHFNRYGFQLQNILHFLI